MLEWSNSKQIQPLEQIAQARNLKIIESGSLPREDMKSVNHSLHKLFQSLLTIGQGYARH